MNSGRGNYSEIQWKETQRERVARVNLVVKNISRVTSRYQISEDQDQIEKIKCLYSTIKDCNRSGLFYLILFIHCIRKKTLCR